VNRIGLQNAALVSVQFFKNITKARNTIFHQQTLQLKDLVSPKEVKI